MDYRLQSTSFAAVHSQVLTYRYNQYAELENLVIPTNTLLV